MKPLSSAKTQELPFRTAAFGSASTTCLARRDDGNAGVVVEYRRDMELGAKTYARYLIWHPIDHIHFTVLQRLSDGSVDPGAIFHLVEDLGAQGPHLIDAALRLVNLDETGAAVELHVLGNTALRIEGSFSPDLKACN